MPFEIRYVRLDDDVCEEMNRLAQEDSSRVSNIVNQIIREYLAKNNRKTEQS